MRVQKRRPRSKIYEGMRKTSIIDDNDRVRVRPQPAPRAGPAQRRSRGFLDRQTLSAAHVNPTFSSSEFPPPPPSLSLLPLNRIAEESIYVNA